jgi:hypothetical protein
MPEERDRSDQPLPGSVSSQNAEEQPGQDGHDKPGQDGHDKSRHKDAEAEKSPSGGGAGEGSQSTGHPENAG